MKDKWDISDHIIRSEDLEAFYNRLFLYGISYDRVHVKWEPHNGWVQEHSLVYEGLVLTCVFSETGKWIRGSVGCNCVKKHYDDMTVESYKQLPMFATFMEVI